MISNSQRQFSIYTLGFLIFVLLFPVAQAVEMEKDASSPNVPTICSQRPGFVSEVLVPGVKPAQIADWLVNMTDEDCRAWHPAHIRYRMKRRTEDYVGSRFYFHEVVGGFHIRGTWKVTAAEWPHYAAFKRVGLPVYWNLVLAETTEGTRVRNEMCYGTGVGWLDRVLVGALHRWVLTAEVRRAIDEHDKEEFLMLGIIIGKE